MTTNIVPQRFVIVVPRRYVGRRFVPQRYIVAVVVIRHDRTSAELSLVQTSTDFFNFRQSGHGSAPQRFKYTTIHTSIDYSYVASVPVDPNLRGTFYLLNARKLMPAEGCPWERSMILPVKQDRYVSIEVC